MSATTSSTPATHTNPDCDRPNKRRVSMDKKPLTDFSIQTLISVDERRPAQRQGSLAAAAVDGDRHHQEVDTRRICSPVVTLGSLPPTSAAGDTTMTKLERRPHPAAGSGGANHAKAPDAAGLGAAKRPSSTIKQAKKFRPKNFQCLVCQMAFSNNGQLKNHVRIHTGERPFQCNYPSCLKTFTRNEELTRHKLIHTGIRPHVCTCCGKTFGRKDHLKKHVKTHDEKRKRARRKLISRFREVGGQLQQQHLAPGDLGSAPGDPVAMQKFAVERETNRPTATTTTTATAIHLFPTQPTAKPSPCFNQQPASNTPSFKRTHHQHQMAAANHLLNKQYLHSLPARPTVDCPPMSAFQSSRQLDPVASVVLGGMGASAAAAAAAAAAATNSIEDMLARDYWQNWYNLIGASFHQHQVCSPAAALERLIAGSDELFRQL